MSIRQKKSLGQHFLNDESIASDIVNSLSYDDSYNTVVEVGVGFGVLTKYLVARENIEFYVIEIDDRLVEWIENQFPSLKNKIIHKDILKVDFKKHFENPFAIIGNFPYQISTQIIFRILENRELIPEMVGMFQKEVAQRITADHGNKQYGITSVLVQAYYDVDYLFEVSNDKFNPPPKVHSAVIRLRRKKDNNLPVEYDQLRVVVKTAFNQRRKTLRNALKPIVKEKVLDDALLKKRAEQLSVHDFILLTQKLYEGNE